MQHIAIRGPQPRPDARAHVAADRAHQDGDHRGTPSIVTRALQYAARMAAHGAADIMASQRTRQRW